MAVYTDITDTELKAFLADFDLGEATSFKGIAEGVQNSNFLLETTRGRYILTIFERRVATGDLPFFLGLMRWLAAAGFPSAAPMADRTGEALKSLRGKPATIVAFLSGLAVSRPTVSHCEQAGEGLAWLHVASEGYRAGRVNALGHASWRGLFEPLAGAADALEAGLATTINDDLDYLSAAWPRGLPEGIVHADWFPDNVFFVDGLFGGAIDFYFAARDAFAYDIAVALNAWCFDVGGAFNAGKARALVSGYERRRPLASAEKTALPVLAHGAAMRFFLTRLADWGATPAGSLVRPKDPLEYVQKLKAHRAGLSGFAAS